MDFINKIFRGDRAIWMIFFFLCLISIVEVYSATSTLAYRRNYWEPITRHIMFLLGGVGIVLLVHSVKPKFFSLLILFLPIAWLLLIATKFIGSSINQADRWLAIGGISFQPSELAKLCLIVSTAFFLSKRKNSADDNTFKVIMIAAAVICGTILIDNFSTAAILFVIICVMMFIGQIPFKKLMKTGLYLGIFLSVFGLALVLLPQDAVNSVFPKRVATWKERIKDFTYKENTQNNDEFVINDDNYQVSHAKIAIARGGLFGKMPGNSQERDFLPQAYSDFIYAIIIEEMGLLGGLVVLLLYVILFIRSGIIASRCEKLFPKYLVIGSALIVVSQALANMAVAVSLMPVTGQPLPLISRGGTSTLITCAYIGIILSVSRFENPKGIEKEAAILTEAQEETDRERAFKEENINAGEF